MTYLEIQEQIRNRYGYVAKTCWIADVKNMHGLTTRVSPNRIGAKRKYPCPLDKVADIETVLRSCGDIK